MISTTTTTTGDSDDNDNGVYSSNNNSLENSNSNRVCPSIHNDKKKTKTTTTTTTTTTHDVRLFPPTMVWWILFDVYSKKSTANQNIGLNQTVFVSDWIWIRSDRIDSIDSTFTNIIRRCGEHNDEWEVLQRWRRERNQKWCLDAMISSPTHMFFFCCFFNGTDDHPMANG